MARLTFNTTNKVEKFSSFPRLKLKSGERARVVCLEDPELVYAHTLRMPELLPNNKPKMVNVPTRSGDTVRKNALEFVSKLQCLGDAGIVGERGADPKNCPACAESVNSDQISAAQRRFAMHVAKYSVKGSGGYDVSEPFSVEIQVWEFGDYIFTKLVDISSDIPDERGLRAHDLNLGPCENEGFQKFSIQAAMKAEYLASPERKKRVEDAFANNFEPDLAKMCGRKVSEDWMRDDVDKVKARWRQALRADSPEAPTESSEATSGDLGTAKVPLNFDDLIDSLG